MKVCGMQTRQVLICGDFNYGEIDWGKGNGGSKSARMFLNVCHDLFLHQHVTGFTRCRGNDKPSLLDLILTKDSLDVDAVKHGHPIGKSDHCIFKFHMHVDSGGSRDSDHDGFRLNYHRGKYD